MFSFVTRYLERKGREQEQAYRKSGLIPFADVQKEVLEMAGKRPVVLVGFFDAQGELLGRDAVLEGKYISSYFLDWPQYDGKGYPQIHVHKQSGVPKRLGAWYRVSKVYGLTPAH